MVKCQQDRHWTRDSRSRLPCQKGVVMKKAIVFGFLILIVGFFLWRMIDAESYNPSQSLAVDVDKENFEWFTCPGCDELFMAEVTTRKGYCPYCQLQIMLITEAKRAFGRSTDKTEFVWLLSPDCGNVFFARDTGLMGICPYCREGILLVAPPTHDLEQPSTKIIAAVRQYSGGIFAGGILLFAFSITGLYFLRQRQVVISLKPVEEGISVEKEIRLSRRQIKNKKLTLSGADDADIVVHSPSLKDVKYTISFVEIGGKTRAYLHQSKNQPIQVNEKPELNPRLNNNDKVRLGDVTFEVCSKEG